MLPHRVTVLSVLSEGFDESGDLIAQDVEKFEIAAFVDENSGREFWGAAGFGLPINERSVVIHCHYDARITERSKMIHEGRIYEINWINDAQKANYFLTISAIEVKRNVAI